MLERAHDQTTILCEHGLPHVGGTQAHHVIKLRLKLIQRASVIINAVSDCFGARKNRRRRRYQAFCTVHRVGDELRTDVSTREVMVEVVAVDLEANRSTCPLLSGSDGLGICLLAGGGTTTVANAQWQVNAYVVKVREDRKPNVGREHTHARQANLVALRFSRQSARASDVALLVRGSRASYLVIQHAGRVAARIERLSWARSNAEAALQARLVVDAHGLVVDINTISWANVKTARTCLGFSGGAPQAAISV